MYHKGGRIFVCVSSPWPIKQGRSVEKNKKNKKMYIKVYQGKVRLHVDLFIKYVSNNGPFYIDITNNWL